MPTITNPFQEEQAPVPTTAKVVAKEIKALSASVAPFLVNVHQQIFNKLWTRSIELWTNPQEVLNELGPDASKLFIEGGKLVDFVLTKGLAIMDPSEYSPKQAPTFNQDGTVTLAP